MAYDDLKRAGRRGYTGMKVGGVHHWEYPDGRWSERKVSPDRWAIHFTSTKRRWRRAPEGTGAKVGAEYHWFVLAHQRARKLDANTYATEMVGTKHMVAFRQPGWQRWSSQFKGHKTQRERLRALLQAALDALDEAPEPGEGLLPLPGMVEVPHAKAKGKPGRARAPAPKAHPEPSRGRGRPARPARPGRVPRAGRASPARGGAGREQPAQPRQGARQGGVAARARS
jgi:hypothetical protein